MTKHTGLSATIFAVLFGWTAQAQNLNEGKELFLDYCAACHGADAIGDGPIAGLMEIETPNLTQLSTENGGAFPVAEVAAQIDGRDPLRAHGGRMPVFGDFFEGDKAVPVRLGTGQTLLTSEPIADLLVWLDSIQS